MEKYFSSPKFPLFTLALLLSLYSDTAPHGYAETLAPTEVSLLGSIALDWNMKPLPSFSNSSCSDPSININCTCPSIETLCHVKYINFSNERLTGIIPPSIANFTHLETLDLSSNYLEGPIPNTLSSMKSLMHLNLSNNFLNGSIPAALGTLPSLRTMKLWGNYITGRIPDELGNISTLKSLILNDNKLFGNLPSKLGQLKQLQYLLLSNNEFSGVLPMEIAELTNLLQFTTRGNNFSGNIPDVFEKWNNLKMLGLEGNNFDGPLPNSISKLTKLGSLTISDLNDKSGRGFPFPNIPKLKSLQRLILRKCSITGQVPTYIWESSSITTLDLSFNSLTGEIPKAITKPGLKYIYLTGNNLTGAIPSWGANWTKIHADFSYNNFTSVSFKYSRDMSKNIILYACCSPTNPKMDSEVELIDFSCTNEKAKNSHLYINCGGNEIKINGSVYEADLETSGASTIYVSKNRNWAYSSTGHFIVSGKESIGYIQSKTHVLNMDDAPLDTSARISPMSLKYYGLCLINGNYSVKLHFAEIVFTDDSDFSSKGERIFDVYIQGELVLKDFNIKKEAGGPSKEIVKNFPALVTNHLLEIHLYWAGKGSLYIPPTIHGPLISAISVTPVQGQSTKLSDGGMAGISVAVLVFLTFLVVYLQQLGLTSLPVEDLKLEIPQGTSDVPISQGSTHLSFSDIKAATGNSPVDNNEGTFGPIYKAVLRNGMQLAVKKLSSILNQGDREYVRNEVGNLSALRHPNLVRLFGGCTEDDQLLLVYENMENKSLSNALFDSRDLKSRLNWRTRYNICLGIAKGLAFLHEESNVKIIHRDIRPSNVLLDENLNAKISDFGLAKLWEGRTTNNIAKETRGHMAPEYAIKGILTNKADVYSFGVQVLELISGKKSTDYKPNDQTVCLLDWAYVLQKNDNLLELIDPDLEMNYPQNEAKCVLDLAMLCTNYSPTLRPIMSEVVSILEEKPEMIKSLPVRPPTTIEELERGNSTANLFLSTIAGTPNPFSYSSSMNKGEAELESLDAPMQNSLSLCNCKFMKHFNKRNFIKSCACLCYEYGTA
ncbi:Protein kinase domain [Macleaya cordata]|uniref:non-specific serine/threonine protein kinase n=1 Tax=Macleaya cordata TaxID=56857 RepID=A0A200PMJ5_MACCD|nr:Protein kinase domain [Macleaya cordata]